MPKLTAAVESTDINPDTKGQMIEHLRGAHRSSLKDKLED